MKKTEWEKWIDVRENLHPERTRSFDTETVDRFQELLSKAKSKEDETDFYSLSAGDVFTFNNSVVKGMHVSTYEVDGTYMKVEDVLGGYGAVNGTGKFIQPGLLVKVKPKKVSKNSTNEFKELFSHMVYTC